MSRWMCLILGLGLVVVAGASGLEDITEDDVECTIKGVLSFVGILDCGDCVGNLKCMYCDGPVKLCFPFPNGLIPSSDICGMGYAKWGTCTILYRTLLIIVGVALAVVIMSMICCCCCCCCRSRGGLYVEQPNRLIVGHEYDMPTRQRYERLEQE